MTTVVAVRHGETDWNREGRLQGWAPTILNERGRRQAAALGAFLAAEYDVDHLYSSDLDRARETAAIVADCLGLPATAVKTETAWRERDLGVYQGLTREELAARFPSLGRGRESGVAVEQRPEGGESFVDLSERVTGRFDDLLAARGDETVLVVTHGGPIHVLLGHAKGHDVATALESHSQHNCAVNEFQHDHETGETRVVRENATPWRDDDDALGGTWDDDA